MWSLPWSRNGPTKPVGPLLTTTQHARTSSRVGFTSKTLSVIGLDSAEELVASGNVKQLPDVDGAGGVADSPTLLDRNRPTSRCFIIATMCQCATCGPSSRVQDVQVCILQRPKWARSRVTLISIPPVPLRVSTTVTTLFALESLLALALDEKLSTGVRNQRGKVGKNS